MARTDALVLCARLVGTSVALHLAKRGLSVALIDRRGPGEETSYGNTGVIVGASVFPTAFPRSLKKLIQVALKRAPEANYRWRDLIKVAPWLIAYYGFSTPEKLKDSAVKLRPLMSRSVGEHKALLEESGAMKYLRETGWITLYRSDAAFEAMKPQLEFGAQIGVAAQPLDTDRTTPPRPSLNPVFRHPLMWPDAAPLCHPKGNASRSRPVIDTEYGYALTPMEQGIRLTTGADFAARDAPATPVQFDRLMPH